MKLSDLSKKKRMGLFIVSGALILAFMVFLVLKDLSLPKGETVAEEVTVTGIEIPDARPDTLESSKLRAYSSRTQAERLWDDAAGFYENSDTEVSEFPEEQADLPGPDLQSDAAVQSRQVPSAPSAVNPAADILVQQPSGGGGREPRPGDADYKDYKMRRFYENSAAAASPGGEAASGGTVQTTVPDPAPAPAQEQRMNVPVDTLRRSASMDLMADSGDDDGFSSLDPSPSGRGSAGRPFECMFVREEKIRNGSRVSVRLLEDLAIGGTLIPRNTHLQAICRIGERLEMSITSIRVGSRIYSISYEAYDNDGYKGIYCPDINQENRRQATSSGLSLFNSLIGSRVGRIASEAVRTGVSIAENKSGEVTVSVPMGYRFFLVQSEQ